MSDWLLISMTKPLRSVPILTVARYLERGEAKQKKAKRRVFITTVCCVDGEYMFFGHPADTTSITTQGRLTDVTHWKPIEIGVLP